MVEDVDKLLGLIELENDIIQKGRKEIARLKEEKITKRAEAWANATGTAKEKEDFVRAEVASIDKAIALVIWSSLMYGEEHLNLLLTIRQYIC